VSPNEMADAEGAIISAETIAALKAGREELAQLFAKARQLDAQVSALRGTGVANDDFDLELAETIAAIRARLNGLVDLLEKAAGEHWTPGLRLKHFVGELRGARSALAAQGMIFDRFNFAVDQIASQAPNNLDMSAHVMPGARLAEGGAGITTPGFSE
jgi:hypothetical protein